MVAIGLFEDLKWLEREEQEWAKGHEDEVEVDPFRVVIKAEGEEGKEVEFWLGKNEGVRVFIKELPHSAGREFRMVEVEDLTGTGLFPRPISIVLRGLRRFFENVGISPGGRLGLFYPDRIYSLEYSPIK